MPADEINARKPIVLWAVPRSRSTAFERTFVERDDFDVLHEPFSATYYHSPERRSDRFLNGDPDEDARAERVLADVLRPRDRPVFVKDMAYHVAAFLDTDLVGRFANSFLIRDPRKALASLHAQHPTFTFEEAGYEQLARLYDYATRHGAPAPVVDAGDLIRDPEGIMRAYCMAMDIPFIADALQWRPQKVPEFEPWDSWHDQAQHSSGIGDVDGAQRALPAHLEPVYQRCLPHYERLRAARLAPTGTTPG